MTLDEFITKLNTLAASCEYNTIKNTTVVVKLDNPSIGQVASAEVSFVCVGFDWDSGKFLIYCDEPIYRNDTPLDNSPTL
jgi:hypothetical protein